MAAVNPLIGEYSCLSAHELEGLERSLRDDPPAIAIHASLHAPAKDLGALDEAERIDRLRRLQSLLRGAPVIVHPDVIEEPERWGVFGQTLVIENLDGRRPGFSDADELADWFAALPHAGLCLDLAHLSTLEDPLGTGDGILSRHGPRLRQVHLSSIGDDGHHRVLERTDLNSHRELLRRCAHVPWIIEAIGPDQQLVGGP